MSTARALPRLARWREAWPDAPLQVLSYERIRGPGLVAKLRQAAAEIPRENLSPSAFATLFVARHGRVRRLGRANRRVARRRAIRTRRRFALAAPYALPCTPADLDYRHMLTASEYADLLDRLAPFLPVDRFRCEWDVAAPRLG